jgi:hypothetical protein
MGKTLNLRNTAMSLNPNQPPPKPDTSGQQAKWNELERDIVAVAAYYIWEKEGRPPGRDLDHWLRAEHNIRRLVDAAKSQKPPR